MKFGADANAPLLSAPGRGSRIIAVASGAVLFAIWMPAWWAAAWFAFTMAWEFLINPALEPMARRRSDRGKVAALFAIRLVGASVFVAGWGSAWVMGGEAAAFVAAAWTCGGLMHCLFYFSDRPLEFTAATLPSMIAALTIPWFVSSPMIAAASFFVALLLFLTLLRGVADRNQLIEARAAAIAGREDAERASQQKSQFVAAISHELRTPLTAVIGYAELIEEEAKVDSRAQDAEDAARIQAAARHLLGLVNEVLDLAKIEAGRLEAHVVPTPLGPLFREIGAILQPLAATRGNRLSLDAAQVADATILTDPGRLKQCVLNLAGNACKFTERGEIAVRARIIEGATGPMLRVAVVDTGPGIPAEVQERLFQPFEQGPQASGRPDGAGLGLAITRRLAALLGGDVSMASALGAGSCFTLTIAAPPVEAAREPERSAA